MNKVTFPLYVALLAGSATTGLWAQDAAAPAATGPDIRVAGSVSAAPGTLYTPRQLLASALENNLELRAKQLDIGISEDRLTIAWGAVVPSFNARAGVDTLNRRNTSKQIGETGVNGLYYEQVRQVVAGVGGRTPFGTTYEISTSTMELDNTRQGLPDVDRRFRGSEYQSMSRIKLTQPLLRDAGLDVNLAEVRLQRSAVMSAEYETRATVENVTAQLMVALFENEFSVENIRVKKQSIALAETLLRDNQRRVDQGVMSPIDITQAQVRLAEAREELLDAETYYYTRQNQLRQLTGVDFVFGESNIEVETSEGLLPMPLLDDPGGLARDLIASSPIYAAALEIVEAEKVRLKYAENQRYPQLDLEGSFGFNGLGDDFGASYDDYSSREEPDWAIGVVLSIPLERKVSRARVGEAEKRKRQALLNVKASEIELLVSLDNAIRGVRSAQESLELVGDSVRLAEEALNAEERRLVSGLTTSYDVLNQQRELSTARTRALAAKVDLNLAITQLYLTQGRLTEVLGLIVDLSTKKD